MVVVAMGERAPEGTPSPPPDLPEAEAGAYSHGLNIRTLFTEFQAPGHPKPQK